MRRRDARGRVPIAAVMDLVGAALRHYNANSKGAGFVPLEPSMAACRTSCCGPKGLTHRVGFWARRRRSDAPPETSARCCRRRKKAPPETSDCCCFYAELHHDRLLGKVVDTCVIIGKSPRQDQLPEKQPRPHKKKKQLSDLENMRAFCPSYEEALQFDPTDDNVVSEEEERHLHCC
ncbi:hypothetical protein E2562_034825 [Oryza meyeriana var. granulata]|uniref:Uncharacterized protein n=1 Tax=Oryza meyeriana var. granulata TaxID=110450 RepID=A0A6G1E7A1_9ORYZ|nr:hypothetical protein E2562_034825 [Oryza meyeriana var. granulata]